MRARAWLLLACAAWCAGPGPPDVRAAPPTQPASPTPHGQPILTPAQLARLHFQHALYNVSIPENSAPRSFVTQAVGEPPLGVLLPQAATRCRFRLKHGDRDKFFKAEERTLGDFCFLLLRTRAAADVLNRERRDHFQLSVRATVTLNDGQVLDADTSIFVTVTDVNDLSPLFYPTDYEANIREDAPLHTSVVRVTAEDADLGLNGEIYYSLATADERFAVHPVTGVVTLTRPLIGSPSSIEVALLARDRASLLSLGAKAPSARANLVVHVQRVNLHAPELRMLHQRELVIDESNAGDVYAVVEGSDSDTGDHVSSLDIVDGDPDGHFRIRDAGPSRWLVAAHALLADSTAPRAYNLTLRAKDAGRPQRLAYITLPVTITPATRAAPVFSREVYEASVAEWAPARTPLVRLKVEEPSALSAQVYIEIVGGNEGGEFTVDAESGVLYTAQTLDAERRSLYTLTVSAVDHGSTGTRHQSSAKVKITVVDCNDNDPVFERDDIDVTIPENGPSGEVVARLVARDADSGENAYISYSIVNSAPVPFEIDHFSGVVRTTRILDYESMRREYIVRVRASDWGLPFRRQAEAKLTVRVRDVNDNRPQFERVDCVGYVPRRLPIGSPLLTLSALDYDAGDVVSYRISAGNDDNCFALDSSTGVLSVACELNEVRTDVRMLNVTATDGTHFADDSSLTLHLAAGGTAGALECRDTGAARRLAALLAAADRANSPDLTDITPAARFADNLHVPDFVDFPVEIKVNESVALGTTLVKIRAHDRDPGYNGLLAFAISSGDVDSVFRIDPDSGELQVIGYLDRERETEYYLNITVTDLGQPPRARSRLLPVTVLDVNDNSPIFERALASLRVTENALNGTIIFKANATDQDAGNFGKVVYSLIGGGSDFCVERDTGVVRVCGALDRERCPLYELAVRATDGGGRATDAAVRVAIDDVNDEVPRWGPAAPPVRVPEDLPIGALVAALTATDPDLGAAGTVTYSLPDSGPDEDTFTIDSVSGIIRTAKPLDFEQRQVYGVRVRATDGGQPALWADTTLLVEVTDVDENAHSPTFSERAVLAKVREDAPPGAAVTRIAAIDADPPGRDSRLAYYILDGDGLAHFTIDDTGEIHTLTPLDRETCDHYWLTICAHDHGLIPRHACIQVYVEIQDVNDMAPWPERAAYFAAVEENCPGGTRVATVRAHDADSTPTNITYSIVAGNPEGLFSIDESTGEIVTTGRALDREASASHALEVACSDGELTTSARVTITVNDINDRAPAFTQRYYDIRVPLPIDDTDDLQNDSAAGEENSVESDDEGESDDDDSRWDSINDDEDILPFYVATVAALDSDAGENGTVKYSARARPLRAVRVNADTGELRAARPVRIPVTLTIRACDLGIKPRCSVCRARVRGVAPGSGAAPRLAPPPPLTVAELDAPGFLLHVLQATDPDADPLYYQIIDGDPRHEFYIGREDGSIILAKRLLWERTPQYALNVSVTDGLHIVTTIVNVTVINDVNEGGVQFEQEQYTVEVGEGAGSGPGGALLALSAKVAGDVPLLYGVASARAPASAKLFRLQERSALLQLARSLDWESARVHELTVWARDQAPRASLAFARVTVYVTAQDEHAPHWGRRLAEARLPRQAPKGTLVAELRAADRDGDPLAYSLRGGAGLFAVDATGSVTLLRELPDDAREFALSVRATGPPPASRAATLPLHIVVADAESTPPRFKNTEIICEVAENEPSGAVLGALELRGGGAGARYALSGPGSELFTVGLTSGSIATAAPLDYERQNLYNLTVTAYDMGGLTAKAHVIVHVVDRNEFAPTFPRRLYTGSVREGAAAGAGVVGAGGAPLVLAVVDDDGPPQRRATYKISPPAAAARFRVHPTTGALSILTPLDYEEAHEHEFTVTVFDAGTPRMPAAAASSTLVRVTVIDEDDTAPQFKQTPTSAIVLLPTVKSVLVAAMSAVDEDTPNDKLSYDIMEGDPVGAFNITSRGEIRIARPDVVPAHARLRVRVSDGHQSATTRVDVTARAPLAAGLAFHKAEYFASVVENSTRIVTVTVLAILGAALNEHVHFSILNPTDEFQIGQTSGAILTTGIALDRESVSTYKLQVLARSGSGEAAREAVAALTITVADVNDNCPVFVGQPYVAAARAGDPPGTLLTVKAIDADAGDNADVRYEMKRGHGELFRVDRKTGEVALRQTLDARDEPYTLVVAAFDGGAPACGADAVVAVRVWAGGAAPRWERAHDILEVREGAASLPPLPRAISPLNRPLIYTLLPTPDAVRFRLAYDTGSLEAREPLDYEEKTEMELIIRAADGVSGAHADLPVTVRLKDDNDNSPRFTAAIVAANVSEAVLVGHIVAIVNATDKDSGDNGRITYSLWSAEPSSLALFSINPDSGVVRVAAALDRELASRHRLTVTARDNGRPARDATSRLLITVTDVNDNAPKLERSVLSVTVSTEAARGLAVARVAAWDPDIDDKLTWTLEGNVPGVEVDPSTGEVRVRRGGAARSVNVSVSDGARAGWARVKLAAAPHDAAAPTFPHLVHEARALENHAPPLLVTTVKAFDTDPGEFGSISYSLPSARHREIFSIDAASGALSTRVPLDRENTSTWEVCVVATDGGGLVRAGAVRVTVGDDNDHAPSFPLREYVASARPHRAAPAIRVEAYDRDVDGRLNYALLAPPGSHAAKALRVDALSGDVSLTPEAAAYEGSVIQAWVVARDSGGRTGEAALRVWVLRGSAGAGLGASLQAPRELRVPEDTAVGQRLTSLLAPSSSPPPRLRLAAAADDRPQPFAIQDGHLVLTAPLDRETLDLYIVGVIAEGSGSPAPAVMSIIRVVVLDVNEHAPEFHSQPYVLSVAENAPPYSTLLQLQAEDPDAGPNGEVRFSLSADADDEVARTFAVDEAGWVTTRAVLDRETRAEWHLPLVASDSGTPALSSRGSLLLRILDVNDEPPRFNPPEMTADIAEDAELGTLVTRLSLTDADAVRSPLTYWIASGDDAVRFSLRGADLLLVRPLDRETKDNYQLRVAASDGKFTAYAVVRIAVNDVNDNPPECQQTYIEHEISEDAPIGTAVDQLRVSDEDLAHNARVRYFLTGDDHQHFTINKDSGAISVSSPLDRETRALYTLRAHAADITRAEWNCSVELTLRMRDVNDNAPTFSARTYSATLPEDADVGTLVAKVHATDADAGAAGSVRYSTLDDGGVFALDTESGVVTLRSPLDRETAAEHRLVVTAQDNGTPAKSATATLRLTVADVNDNPPEFELREYRATVPELAEPGAEILRVRAASRDTGLNAQVHYELLAGDARADFTLDRESGALLVARPLDYERRRDYLLTIQAVDAGDPPLSDVATVNITVLDANDNAPVFSQSSYSARVRENAPINERIIQVIADDADSEVNGRVTYSILHGDPAGHFSIDPDTGYVSVAAALDREMTASYSLQLRARDRGVPALDATVQLAIDILDANDNPPLFSNNNYSVVVREDRPLGSTVLRLEVTDADAAPNGAPFTFDLQAGNEAGAFRIEADGTLRTATRYNHRLRDSYTLQLRVFDNGTPPLYSDTTVRVRIVQESQYPPVVTPLDVAVTSYLDEFPGGVVGRVHAADRDTYDTLAYSLTPLDTVADLFSIDATDGTLRAAPRLDVGDYRLNVTVDDGKFVGFAIVRVSVALVTDDLLAQAIVVRFREVTDRDFVLGHRKGFLRAVAEATECEPTDVVIISVQPSGEGDSESENDNEAERRKRQVAQDLDVAFAVRGSGGVMAADTLRRRLHAHLERLEERARLVVEELLRAACGGCERGTCAERVELRQRRLRVVSTDVYSLAAPAHRLRAACACEPGWAGERCSDRAAAAAAPVVSLSGDAYLQYRAPRGAVAGRRVPDDELELSLRLRTRRPRGTLLAAAGDIEYGTLEVVDGHVQFRMDVGAGEVALRAGGAVDDGEWHDVRLERRGAAVRLTVDRRAATALAPAPDAVLDAPHDRLLIGAQLVAHQHPDAVEQITYGFEGCMSDLRLGEELLPLEERETSSGVSLVRKVRVRVAGACGELRAADACAAHPCLHGGTCRVLDAGGFACSCHVRFAGSQCERDTQPCAGAPCLHGGTCVPANGSWRCVCSEGLSGARCERGRWCGGEACLHGGACEDGARAATCRCRGYWGARCEHDVDECAGEPCLNGATCLNEPGSFRCLCPPDKTGMNCGNPLYSDAVVAGGAGAEWGRFLRDAWRWTLARWWILAVVGAVLLLLLMLPFVLRKKRREPPPVLPPPAKLSNLAAAARRDRPLSSPPLNNVDTLRSYGSAGDELELPPDYIRNLNIDPDRKPWSEQMHLHTFVDNKIYNDLKGAMVAGTRAPLGEPRLIGGYHWDCSDWCGAAPPGLQELPGSERRDSSEPSSPRRVQTSPRTSPRSSPPPDELRARTLRAPDAASLITMLEERNSLLGDAESECSELSANLCEIEESDVEESPSRQTAV